MDNTDMASPAAVASRTELSKSAENLAVDQRIKKKAKRLTRHLSKEGVPNGVHVIQTTRSWKNTRRPRNGYGRGLPKKGHSLSLLLIEHLCIVKSESLIFYNFILGLSQFTQY